MLFVIFIFSTICYPEKEAWQRLYVYDHGPNAQTEYMHSYMHCLWQ